MLDLSFRISVTSREPAPLPTERFSVRETSAIWLDGMYCPYAYVVPWDNSCHM